MGKTMTERFVLLAVVWTVAGCGDEQAAPLTVSNTDALVTDIEASEEATVGSSKWDRGTLQSSGFSNCTAHQKQTIKKARAAAQRMVRTGLQSLKKAEKKGPAQDNYEMWFSDYAPFSADIVERKLTAIERMLREGRYVFDCKCDPGSVATKSLAYVDSRKTGSMWVCDLFFRSSLTTGEHSQAGTLIHETSHYVTVAKTYDHANGKKNCQRLAQSNAYLALGNADNYKYFCQDAWVRGTGCASAGPLATSGAIVLGVVFFILYTCRRRKAVGFALP